MNFQTCISGFSAAFGDAQNTRVFFAPGRVNLIGEHTDYNGGHAFPCALTMGTYAAVRRREDRTIRFFSDNFASTGIAEYSLDELQPGSNRLWTAYPCGVVWALARRGMELPEGFDFWVKGNIPNGSGLSSSASLEVLTAFALRELYGLSLTNADLARLGQESENDFVGMHCGIMDQFAIAMGKKDCAVFLDADTLDYTYAPLKLDGVDILIMDTRKKRGLKDSKYNDRVKECGEAMRILAPYTSAGALCRVPLSVLEEHRAEMDEVLYRRARHAVTEDIRTREAVEALQAGDLARFGELMNASHRSLESDYEVTGKELDTLVHTAWDCEGVIGARMTGAGFGGCAVALCRSENTKAVTEKVGKVYTRETGLTAAFYIAAPGDGPKEVF